MTLESINYVALFAGALLLMSRFGHRVHRWSLGKNPARSELDEKLRTEADGQQLSSSHVGVVAGATATCIYGGHYV